MASLIPHNIAAIPAEANTEADEQRYPILGHLVWYSLRDVRIKRPELESLLQMSGIDSGNMPPEIRAPDAFRRATSSITTHTPRDIGDGKFENIMVRDVYSDSTEIVRHIIREETDSQNKRINYGKIGQIVFNRQLEKLSVGIDPRFEHHKAKIKKVYDEYIEYYTGKHIRDMVFRMLNSTTPVSVRPAGGVYFISKVYSGLVESLEQFVTDINGWGVPGTAEAVFESVPMLDIEKQRRLIFDKYESQCAYSVDTTLNELSALLKSSKTPTKGVLAKYIDHVKDLKSGIAKYETLLEKEMDISRAKCQLLQEQVIQLLNKTSNEV
ncbi:MAG: hypothetical protein HF975_04245 [ANME-2 cluster archaeon]|nr:hypothetical protein [ANME-2 cluster archaeon]